MSMQASLETVQQISQKESVTVIQVTFCQGLPHIFECLTEFLQNLISISVAEVLCRRGIIRDESLESIRFAGFVLLFREILNVVFGISLLLFWQNNFAPY